MLEIINSKEFREKYLKEVMNRGKISFKNVDFAISKLISEVKSKGDFALIRYTEKFDEVTLKKEDLVVTKEEIEGAYEDVDDTFLTSFKVARNNVEKFHEAQFREKWYVETQKGIQVGQVMRPLQRIGLYVPGGRFPYPSTVIMGTIPATVAGVKEMYVATPPNKEGKINPCILVAASECNVTKIYKVGGAQAISAFAYGTETIKPVDKIFGPGNIYVMAAKNIVSNDVLIDLPAGPSEILIISDESSNSKYISLDILAQAEHDPSACCYLLTTSKKIASEVLEKLKKAIESLEETNLTIKNVLEMNFYTILVNDIEEAVELSNKIAPEHLEILVNDPESYLNDIKNAGAIFLGEFCPVAIGDYAAGSNHILPTGGLARLYSGLSILDYVKVIDVVKASREGLKNIKKCVVTLALKEGLKFHAKSVSERLDK